MDLAVSLLFWIALGALLAAQLGLFYRRQAVQGTLPSPEAAFASPPGTHYYRLRERRGQHSSVLVEHFTVSVQLPKEIEFELVSNVPPALSATRLAAYSDDLFARLFEGYVTLKGVARGLPADRSRRSALVLALSAVPHSTRGTLTARQGRLVLQWARDYEDRPGTHTLTKEAVLAHAAQELEQLAAALRIT